MKVLVGTANGLHEVGSGQDFEGREVTALTARNGTLWALLDGRELLRRSGDSPWESLASIDAPRSNNSLTALRLPLRHRV